MRSTSRSGRQRVPQWIVGAVLFATGAGLCACSRSAGKDPIKIGVIGEESSVAGASLTKAALLAADEINAQGGVNGRPVEVITYDNHSSAAEGVRAFQRSASDDKVVAVIGSYLSEVAFAIEPWSARMRLPYITPGATSSEIPKRVHDDYEHNKFTFQGITMSEDIAQSVCDFSHDILVNQFHLKKAVVMSEDAAWTKPLDARYTDCLPKAGLEVLDHIRFNPDTTDFTPIFNQIERQRPDVIITGISHVGVQPTVQWHDQQVPIPLAGQSAQATNGTFWKDTNGATEGVITRSTAAPGVALTSKTVAFADAYAKRYGQPPAYCGYTSYDMVYVIAEAIKRAASTDSDRLVDELEKTDYLGTSGRLQFYGRGDALTHGLKYGPGLVTGVHLQWQSGRQVAIWPTAVANGKMAFPSFIKLTQKTTAK